MANYSSIRTIEVEFCVTPFLGKAPSTHSHIEKTEIEPAKDEVKTIWV